MQSKNQYLSSAATLLACRSIAQAFAENIYELAHLRRNWSVGYADALKKEVTSILEKHFSDEIKHLRPEKINEWRELLISSLTDLAIIRACVKVDFKDDKAFQKDFFQTTGYTQYFSDAKNGDHVSMYHFIKAFAGSITPDTIAKITEQGLNVNVVSRVIETAKSLDAFWQCFEIITDPELVDSVGQKKLEDLYHQIQDICRIATAYYYFDPLKRESFNFFKALRNIQK